MAVPPVGAQAVISAVLKTFAGIPYNFVESKVTNGEINAQASLNLFNEAKARAIVVL